VTPSCDGVLERTNRFLHFPHRETVRGMGFTVHPGEGADWNSWSLPVSYEGGGQLYFET
jgi:hypothetical protein